MSNEGKEKVHLNLAKFKSGQNHFEIVVDPDIAMNFKLGKTDDVQDALKYEKIFSDAKKGLESSEQQLEQVFKTTDALEIAKKIIKEGEVQVSQEYREEQRNQKRKRIVAIIHRNAVDPKTHVPHPATRIENAMDAAKVKIDEKKSAEDQIDDIVTKLREQLPIKFEVKEIAIRLPGDVAQKSYGVIKNSGKIIKEEWQNDGSLIAVVEIPGGLEEEFYDKINASTHGNNEAKVINTR
tara:strand:- start:4691 stop:5404 length:714 start_codon:yes stop_codon:yes gene_type:complete